MFVFSCGQIMHHKTDTLEAALSCMPPPVRRRRGFLRICLTMSKDHPAARWQTRADAGIFTLHGENLKIKSSWQVITYPWHTYSIIQHHTASYSIIQHHTASYSTWILWQFRQWWHHLSWLFMGSHNRGRNNMDNCGQSFSINMKSLMSEAVAFHWWLKLGYSWASFLQPLMRSRLMISSMEVWW